MLCCTLGIYCTTGSFCIFDKSFLASTSTKAARSFSSRSWSSSICLFYSRFSDPRQHLLSSIATNIVIASFAVINHELSCWFLFAGMVFSLEHAQVDVSNCCCSYISSAIAAEDIAVHLTEGKVL